MAVMVMTVVVVMAMVMVMMMTVTVIMMAMTAVPVTAIVVMMTMAAAVTMAVIPCRSSGGYQGQSRSRNKGGEQKFHWGLGMLFLFSAAALEIGAATSFDEHPVFLFRTPSLFLRTRACAPHKASNHAPRWTHVFSWLHATAFTPISHDMELQASVCSLSLFHASMPRTTVPGCAFRMVSFREPRLYTSFSAFRPMRCNTVAR